VPLKVCGGPGLDDRPLEKDVADLVGIMGVADVQEHLPTTPISHGNNRPAPGGGALRALLSLDQESTRMRNVLSIVPNLLVQSPEAISIPLNAEVRHDPDHESQEVDDCAYVIEHSSESFLPKVSDHETGSSGFLLSEPVVSRRSLGPRSHDELAEILHTVRPDLLGKVRPTRKQHSCNLSPPGRDGMTTGD
jgi:hypothetical protein